MPKLWAVLGIRQPAVGDRIPVLAEQLENVPALLRAVPARTIPAVSSPDRWQVFRGHDQFGADHEGGEKAIEHLQ
jgi:hypothetical protein